ncbi:M20 family metallo-hydrolase [Fictibacillus phosphorivorans]|uniref:M20 family metallo-hydrolase n=1 Tax=Fictibacillus phosphorivorans TaxID=1221500 RepID=UPI00203E4A37|nr:M20 family metallo-hydrolase [Fictibacillus phosphorivorans]MCM3717663.1 M20 family metallo-hydrolase [Fictibacillus phosphorivorans]MCM3775563.1 M20 family metallo-hydrolase [Fictibacillus phosphorivorans]
MKQSVISTEQWLEEHLLQLNLVEDMNQPNGFSRLGYSPEEWEAHDIFIQIAEKMGLTVRRDQAGNVIARWNPVNAGNTALPAVSMGSHLDTVKGGGGYDGVAGILCALGAIKVLKEEGFEPTHPLEVICFASEESSRFPISTIGSKAMSGIINPKELQDLQDAFGTTVKQAFESRGLHWGSIQYAEREQNEIKSFVELHIEQGMRIEHAGAEFGVATAVACPIRLSIQIEGKMGHTGTTPMGMRQDALVAAAPLITFISEKAEELSKESEYPIVATASTLTVQPNAMNVIPGTVMLGVDIRSVDDSLKERFKIMIKEKCQTIEKEKDVTIKVETIVHNASIHLNRELSEKLKKIGESLGYSPLVMESGAGHDVMNMSKKWPSSLIFIKCRDGLSHHPKEHATLEDLRIGVEILVGYLQQEAGNDR